MGIENTMAAAVSTINPITSLLLSRIISEPRVYVRCFRHFPTCAGWTQVPDHVCKILQEVPSMMQLNP